MPSHSIPYHVKGDSIVSKFDFVRETFGDEAAVALEDFFRDRGVESVDPNAWYNFGLFDDALRFIAEQHLDGDLERLREVGEYSAQKVLTTTYQLFLKSGEIYEFLDRVRRLHGMFYDVGRLKLEDRRPDGCTLRVIGAPEYREADLQVAAGFYCGAARLIGHDEARCTFERDPRGVAFNLSWSPMDR